MADLYHFPNLTSEETGDHLRDYRKETSRGHGRMDLPFLVMTLLLLVIGLVMVLSASYARSYYENDGNATSVFTRQLLLAATGVVWMLAASRFSAAFYRRFAFWTVLAAIALLIMVLLIGTESGGARRWIGVGNASFQPSELAKVAVILSFAHMSCVYGEKMKTFKYGVLPFAGILGVILLLLVLEPHLSACVIIVAIGGIMMFLGGTKFRWFALVLGVGLVAGLILVGSMDYAGSRVEVWRDPEGSELDGAWQITQSLYAIGSGGLMGLGLGQSRQKFMYLPEEHNDFIFAVVCEELGFIGAVLILALFAILILRGFWLGMHARDKFSGMVILGITSLLAIQVFLNVAVVTNLVPCTGISLPFFSYGGTALWVQLAEMGIVLAMSRDITDK